MGQIRLVADHHDDDARVGMVAELTKPPVDIVEALPLRDVVNKESANSAPVVSTRDGTISLLPCCVPDLGLYCVGDLQGFGGELDADGGLGVEREVVAGEAGEDVGLADAAVADQHHLEEVGVLVIHPAAHLAPSLRGKDLPSLLLLLLLLRAVEWPRRSLGKGMGGRKRGEEGEKSSSSSGGQEWPAWWVGVAALVGEHSLN
uniref:Uncharacterized protein n=1 Tax=Oryza brachyantha TaxID=4533 RepID=J3M5G5_ORYBR